MSIKVKKKNAKAALKLLLFATYNFFYAFYMAGYLSRNIYLFAMAFFCFVCMVEYYTHPHQHIGRAETKPMAVFILSICVITLCIQIINLRFSMTQWSYMLYWTMPLVAAFYWFNTTANENREIYFYVLLARFVLTFILTFGAHLNLSNILSIRWGDSMSSVFESSDAHNFLFMTMVFLLMDKKILAYVSAFFCLISFKRLSFILVIVLLVLYKKIPFKKVSSKITYLAIVFFCISPLIVLWILSPQAEHFFSSIGFDINLFTSNRIKMIQQITSGVEASGGFNGFGTMNAYMQTHPYGIYHLIYIMHCDYYMLMKECTIIAPMIFTIAFLKPASKDWHIFLMALYICFEMVVSTFFTSMASWTIFYMFEFFMFYKYMEEKPHRSYYDGDSSVRSI